MAGVRGLIWDKVDFSARKATVWVKGQKWQDVPLTDFTMDLIDAQPRACETVFTYVAQRSRGEKRKGERYPITKGGWRKSWNNALSAAGVKDFRYHDFRHTFGSRFIRSGGGLLALKEQLAHESIASTIRYAHVIMDDRREAMERLDSSAKSGGRVPRGTK